MLLCIRKEVNIVLNQAVLIGRIVKDPELKNTEKGNVANITLAVPRSFKNQNGEYDTDFIPEPFALSVALSFADTFIGICLLLYTTISVSPSI